MKSSNSQLFKSTESSGAIPLTFNNSIAEVLAAASKAKLKGGRIPSPKPEITITAKSSKDSSGLKISKKMVGAGYPVGVSHSGGLSILKRTITSSSPSSGGGSVNPLSNMSKLLQSTAPGLPPHIIAQQTMTGRGSSSPKVMSRPPVSSGTHFRPVQLSSGKHNSAATAASSGGGGIQTVNKKSLTTVLDRLSCLTTAGSPTQLSTALSSSLVQQLQAPLVSNRSGGATKSSKANKDALRAQISNVLGSATNSIPSTTTTLSSALPGSMMVPGSYQLNQPSILQFPGGAGGGVMDPSLMFPNMMGSNMAAQAQTAAAQAAFNGSNMAQAQTAAAQEAFNMMAIMSGLTQQQAVEMLQQQQKLLNQQQQRVRGPPPLKNMSRKPD